MWDLSEFQSPFLSFLNELCFQLLWILTGPSLFICNELIISCRGLFQGLFSSFATGFFSADVDSLKASFSSLATSSFPPAAADHSKLLFLYLQRALHQLLWTLPRPLQLFATSS